MTPDQQEARRGQPPAWHQQSRGRLDEQPPMPKCDQDDEVGLEAIRCRGRLLARLGRRVGATVRV